MKLKTELRLTFIAFLVVPTALFVAFYVYPAAYTFYISLHRWDGFSPDMVFVGLGNYARLLAQDRFFHAFQNNVLWLVFYLLLPTSLGLLIAALLNQRVRGANAFKVIFFIPYTITPVAVAAIWRWLFDPGSGLLNAVLAGIGLGDYTQNWLGNRDIATYSIMLAALWWSTGFAFLVYFAGIRNVPTEYVDAARIDGASYGQLFVRIIFPLLLPYTIVILAMSGIAAMRMFDLIWSLTSGGPAYASDVLATQMFDVSFDRFDMGSGSAIAVMLLLISATIILPYIVYTTRRLERMRD